MAARRVRAGPRALLAPPLLLLLPLLLGPWPAAGHGGKYSREKNEPGPEFRMEKLNQLWEKAQRVSGAAPRPLPWEWGPPRGTGSLPWERAPRGWAATRARRSGWTAPAPLCGRARGSGGLGVLQVPEPRGAAALAPRGGDAAGRAAGGAPGAGGAGTSRGPLAAVGAPVLTRR